MKNILKTIKEHLDIDLSIDRATVVDRIQDNIPIKGTQFWFLIASSLIACIGLNMNSAALIIGAMLISPLMGPLLGIGMGLAFQKRWATTQALKYTGISILVSVAFSTLYFYASPFDQPSPEIMARISPTLLDLLVAVAAAFAGVVATISPRFSATAAGVAVAIAVMPPLCATGFGIANHRWDIAGGAFYLFFVNAIAIIYITYLLLRKIHFREVAPTKKTATPAQLLSKTAIYITLILLSIPLGWTLFGMVNSYHHQKQLSGLISDFKADSNIVNWRVDSKGKSIKALHIYTISPPSEEKLSSMQERLSTLSPNAKIVLHAVSESSETREFIEKFKNSPLYPALTNTALLRDMLSIDTPEESVAAIPVVIVPDIDYGKLSAEARALLGESYRVEIYADSEHNIVVLIDQQDRRKISIRTQAGIEQRLQDWLAMRLPDSKQLKILWDKTKGRGAKNGSH